MIQEWRVMHTALTETINQTTLCKSATTTGICKDLASTFGIQRSTAKSSS